MNITITRDHLVALDACADGLAAFDAAYPEGLEYDPTDAACVAALLSGPCARYEVWAVQAGVLPPARVSAGYRGTATAGYRGTATAGYRGTATAGDYGAATAGERGTVAVWCWCWAARRRKLAVAYVGESAPGLGGPVKAGTPYTATWGKDGPVWREVTP